MNGTEKIILIIAAAAAVTLLSWSFMAVPEMQNMLMDHHNPGEFVGAEQGSENSRIIAELHKSVDILDKSVAEALERAEYRVRNIHRSCSNHSLQSSSDPNRQHSHNHCL